MDPLQQPQDSMMDVFSPDGAKGKVPAAQWPDAVKNGFKPAVRVTDPSGNGGWVPSHQAGDAITKHGFKLGPPDQQPGTPILEGYQKAGHALMDWASDTGKGLLNLIKPPETPTEKASMIAGPLGPILTRVIGGTAAGMSKSMKQSQDYGSQIKYATDDKGDPLFDAEGQMQLSAKTPEEFAQNVNNDMRSKVAAVSSLNPLSAPVVSEVNDLKDQGKPEEAAVRGLANAALLGTGEDVSVGLGKTLKAATKIPAATRAAFTRTAAQTLGSAIKPVDIGAFQSAADIAMPHVARAANSRGIAPTTVDSVLDSISQAKSDALRDASDGVSHLGELAPEEAAQLNQKITALNTFQKGLEEAKARIANQKPVTPTVANGVLSHFQKPAKLTTLANLDAGVSNAFGKLKSSLAPVAEPPSSIPEALRPFVGDLSVTHETNIAPPRQAYGDAVVTPEETLYPSPGASSVPEIIQRMTREYPETRADVAPPAPEPASAVHDEAHVATKREGTPIPEALAEMLSRVNSKDLGGMGNVETGVNPSTPTGSRPVTRNVFRPKQAPFDANNLSPDQSFKFSRSAAQSGEDAANEWLTAQSLGRLKSMVSGRGIHFDGSVDPKTLRPQLIDAIAGSLSDNELQNFGDQAIERSRFSAREGSKGANASAPLTGQDLIEGLKEMAAKKTAAGGSVPPSIRDLISEPSSKPSISLGTPTTVPNAPDVFDFPINDGRGTRIGHARVSVRDDGTAEVGWLGPDDRAGGGKLNLGPAGVRDLMRQFSVNHPDVKFFQGKRITGAHSGGVETQHGTQTIPVPKKISDLMFFSENRLV